MIELSNYDRLAAGLNDQVLLLLDACSSYDQGNERQHKNIANQLWILFGNSGQQSLVSQIVGKTRVPLQMFNSCPPYSPQNLMDSFNLIMMMMSFENGVPKNMYLPILDGTSALHGPDEQKNWLKLKSWWSNNKVLVRPQEAAGKYTRENLVRLVRNTMGGAHFDPQAHELELAYGQNAGPMRAMTGHMPNIGQQAEVGRPLDNSALAAQIRQIGHEALRSFQHGAIDLSIPYFAYDVPRRFGE
jgi:hypothetical protein